MTEPRTVKDYLALASDFLRKKGMESHRLEAEVLLSYVLQMNRTGLYVNYDKPLNKEEVDSYRAVLIRRAQKEPVAYITGTKEFLSILLAVNSSVLIPRPETELLVEKIVPWAKGQGRLRIVDVGTGSGAIVIALASLLPETEFWAVDISPEAVEVASANAARLNLQDRIRFYCGKWLEPVYEEAPFDLVVSNPPYIPSGELADLAEDIKDWEPVMALDGGIDGLESIKELLVQARKVLSKEGNLVMEVGADQAGQVVQLGIEQGYVHCQTYLDYAKIERVVWLKKND
jgi:release factor glutamine methyltransferase